MSEELSHYIEFRHVYKTFDKPVLIDSNFYVDSGETVAIIGRSGVGKSVTLGHIMGFLKPDSGQIIVAHEDITNYPESELRRIHKKVTMVFQSGALFDPIMSTHLSDLMLRLKDKLQLTAVVVTHDLALMRKVADRVVFLHDGHVIFFGPTADLEHSDHPFIQEFLAMDRIEKI